MPNPQKIRHKIQSTPFSFGERAHPGIPMKVIVLYAFLISPKSIKFPGSTGIPKRKIFPLFFFKDFGTTSFLSHMAEAPKTKIKSAFSSILSCIFDDNDLIS